MMKISLLCIAFLIVTNVIAQDDSTKAVTSILTFQKTINDEYTSEDKLPLSPDDRKNFNGLPFFPISFAYRVNATLELTGGTPFLQLKTTTSRLDMERIYGYIKFTIGGKDFRLPVYQSRDLMKTKEYADYLFFPFSDLTNGKETYDGGRYIDLRIPAGTDQIVIDFNQAYNPYCAYNHIYSCPLIPVENNMDIAIHAGVMYSRKSK